MIDSSQTPPSRGQKVLVVGSGFGGAVAACRLAQAGFSVCVIERGRRFEAGDFPPLPTDSMLLPDLRRWAWTGQQGLWDVVDLDELVSVQAAGLGGGSLLYANVHLRPPASVFASHWPEVYQEPSTLEPYFDLAAYMLEVAPVSEHPSFFNGLVKTDQLRQSAEHLKRSKGFFYPPLAIRYTDGPNVHGVEQKACSGCGQCSTGCPERAKNTLDFNYLALAERHGAQVLTQCEVLDVIQEKEGWVLRCFNHLTACHEEHRAPTVFLCAGSVHSTRLLARAKLSGTAEHVKRSVGTGYFPGGDAVGVVYGTEHPQEPSRGPTITSSFVHWDRAKEDSFFLLQDGGYGEGLARLVGTLAAPAWLGRNRLTRRSDNAVVPVERSAQPMDVPKPNEGRFVLSSAVDEVAAAWSNGDLNGILSKEVMNALRSQVAELAQPMLLGPVIDHTVNASFRDFWKKRSLTRRMDPERWPLRWAIAFQKWLVERFVGGSDELAIRALQAIGVAGGLGAEEVLQRVVGYDASGASRRTMLLAMGRDAAPGVLHYDPRSEKLKADLDLFHLAPGYAKQECLMSDVARTLGGELRSNPAQAFLGKAITVHSQGGCNMGDHPPHVTTPEGAVRGCQGLFVLDAAAFSTSVGVNPSATILAIAERNVECFIESQLGKPWHLRQETKGQREYFAQRSAAAVWMKERTHYDLSPPDSTKAPSAPFDARPLGLSFRESLQGFYSPRYAEQASAVNYRKGEAEGRPDYPIELKLKNSIQNLNAFFEDMNHEMEIQGSVEVRLPNAPAVRSFDVSGFLQLFVPRLKLHGIDPKTEKTRLEVQQMASDNTYRTVVEGSLPANLRHLVYSLTFRDDESGDHWLLRGHKNIQDNPGFDAWRDTTALFVRMFGPFSSPPDIRAEPPPEHRQGVGVVHVDLSGFLYKQLPSFEVTNTEDPARVSFAITKFVKFFFGELQNIYSPEISKWIQSLLPSEASARFKRSRPL